MKVVCMNNKITEDEKFSNLVEWKTYDVDNESENKWKKYYAIKNMTFAADRFDVCSNEVPVQVESAPRD